MTHRIDHVASAGAQNHGEEVFLDVACEDGNQVRLECPHGRLGHFVALLHTAAGIAAAERAKVDPLSAKSGGATLQRPMTVQRISIGRMIDGEKLVTVGFVTGEVYVTFALSPEDARFLCDGLDAELANSDHGNEELRETRCGEVVEPLPAPGCSGICRPPLGVPLSD